MNPNEVIFAGALGFIEGLKQRLHETTQENIELRESVRQWTICADKLAATANYMLPADMTIGFKEERAALMMYNQLKGQHEQRH